MFIEKIPVRIRLSLGHAVWVGLIFIAIGFGVYRMVEDSLFQTLDNTLMTSARTIRDTRIRRSNAFSVLGRSPFWKSILDEFYSRQRLAVRAYAQMVDISGQVKAKTQNIRANLPVTPRALARAEKGLETFESFKPKSYVPFRQVTLPIMRDGKFSGELIQVGAPIDMGLDTLNSLKRMLWVTLSLGLAFSIIFGYQLTRWSFQPVTRITKAAATLGIKDLSTRLKLPPAKDELQLLILTFNEMLDRLEDAFNRLNRFPGDVSHELRTPLAVLKGEAELALRRDRSSEDYKKALQAIVDESNHMSMIVEDLLLLARAKGNSLALKWEKVNLERFVIDLQASIKKQFEEKKVFLSVKNLAVPHVKISPGFFSLALKNILLNACKHSPKNSRVEFNIRNVEGGTEFSIKDSGEGIAKESQPYIFDTFYRVDSVRNRSAGGIGIGLSLAQALINLHSGKLSVDSEVGKGATFKVFIPVEPPQVFRVGKSKSKNEKMFVTSQKSDNTHV